MSNNLWDFKNEVLRGTGHLTLNMGLIDIKKWDINQINIRTCQLIDKICLVYPYPEVVAFPTIGERHTINECINYIFSINEVEEVKKGNSYKTKDNQNGYIILTSKTYEQGEKEKYWFGYREKQIDKIKECRNKYLIFGCGSKKTKIVKMPIDFLKERLNNLNTSLGDNGDIKHYHIVLFSNPDDTFSMLLSKPELKEINISNLVVKN